jgi:hypothetical protein
VKTITVNTADWQGPELPGAVVIVNAPRPLLGTWTWEGPFRHGVFYAAMPATPAEGDDWEARHHADVLRLWEADDAWQVEFTDDDKIAGLCAAKAAQHGYASLADAAADGITVEELAAMLHLPWHGGGGR